MYDIIAKVIGYPIKQSSTFDKDRHLHFFLNSWGVGIKCFPISKKVPKVLYTVYTFSKLLKTLGFEWLVQTNSVQTFPPIIIIYIRTLLSYPLRSLFQIDLKQAKRNIFNWPTV